MQGAEIEDKGSALKYMTKAEIEKQRSSLLVMTQRPLKLCQSKYFRVQSTTTARNASQRLIKVIRF